MPVDIALDEKRIFHHILTAGSTGGGKTNTDANIVATAIALGLHVFVLDHKPDFTKCIDANPRRSDGHGLGNVSRYTLGVDPQFGQIITVPFSDVDLDLLGAAIFNRKNEELMEETFVTVANCIVQENRKAGRPVYFPALVKKILSSDVNFVNATLPMNQTIHARNWEALQRRLASGRRTPEWIDRLPGTGISPVTLDVAKRMTNPGVTVVHIPDSLHGSLYALFLKWLFSRVTEIRKDSELDSCPVLHLIEEASDLFSFDSRRLQEQVTGDISEEVRKGRSLKIGFCFSLQSAGDIPPEIRNNLLTKIIFRHEAPDVLRDAVPALSSSLFARTTTLMPGEAYVSMFGVPGILSVRMDLSLCKLRVL
jgi:hypothetical protein